MDLDGLRQVVARRGTVTIRNQEATVRRMLAELEQRTSRGELPDAILRIAVGEIRLEIIIMIGNLKVAMLYEHQWLMAPTEKLRSEIQSSAEETVGNGLFSSHKRGALTDEFRSLADDLETVSRIEQKFRNGNYIGAPVLNQTLL